ncbi:VWA domain-containing protein [Haloplanus sp. C73]|uniref:VWA domain-containing protein n=1 Tax=Haloplanus sp. C73 TaxID=3421641 RepID=UPI003EC10FEE
MVADTPLTDSLTHVRSTLVRFVGALRTAGVEVPADGSLVAAEALATVGFDDEATARTALRAALLSRPEDRATFDRLFDRFWTEMQDAADENADLSSLDGGLNPGIDSGDDGLDSGDESRDDDGGEVRTRRVENEDSTRSDADETRTRYSPTGASTRVESETLGMVDEPTAAVRALTDALASRPGRRRRPSSPGQPDIRRAMRESHATGGVVMDLPEHAARPTTVRGLVLVDVSRSVLDTLDREFLVSVLRALTDEWREVRTFLFDTDVTEVTAALRAESPETTLQEFDRLEAAWGGGTRIGHALTTIRDTAPMAVDRDTVVLILSDGLETGEVSQLEAGMSWLDRRARRVFWLNPLAASTAYEPTCRGMSAALPHLDGLFAFAEPADLFDLARQIRRRRRPVGYEHDWRRTER